MSDLVKIVARMLITTVLVVGIIVALITGWWTVARVCALLLVVDVVLEARREAVTHEY